MALITGIAPLGLDRAKSLSRDSPLDWGQDHLEGQRKFLVAAGDELARRFPSAKSPTYNSAMKGGRVSGVAATAVGSRQCQRPWRCNRACAYWSCTHFVD
jgi:hypothetical protein